MPSLIANSHVSAAQKQHGGAAARLQLAKDVMALLKQWMHVALNSLNTATFVDASQTVPPHLDSSPPPLPVVGEDLLKAAPGNSSDRSGGEAILQALQALMVVRSLSGRYTQLTCLT